MREVCLLIGKGGAVLWGDLGSSALAIPDSRARWEAIWRLKDELEEIAHSHPVGPDAFSSEDESTMEALASALPKVPRFSVLSPAGLRVRHPDGREGLEVPEPWWTALLRAASGMRP